MTTKDKVRSTEEALRLALVAERVLKAWEDPQGMPALCEEMNCLREALAESRSDVKPWVGLTDEERAVIFGEFGLALMPVRKAIAEDIEAKLKEKNDF